MKRDPKRGTLFLRTTHIRDPSVGGRECAGLGILHSGSAEPTRWVTGLEVLRTADDLNPALPLRTLNYGNYGIFLIVGNAGFVSSTVERLHRI